MVAVCIHAMYPVHQLGNKLAIEVDYEVTAARDDVITCQFDTERSIFFVLR